ncbi:MAG: HU family DNA-binding protein [Gammaproteobacteria bacterium]|nr:HU family DNA-binding protein [Gammaproteobacteria bacterium]MCP5136408.1 HU family DNA-binding protein [Gammaproteobacteria bacterium]
MGTKVNGTSKIHPPTKAETYALIARDTGLTRQQVAAVFDSLYSLARNHLVGDAACGRFAIPGLAKVHVVERAGTQPRRGVNPVTGESIVIPAKPARQTVKLQPLKPLRDLLEQPA